MINTRFLLLLVTVSALSFSCRQHRTSKRLSFVQIEESDAHNDPSTIQKLKYTERTKRQSISTESNSQILKRDGYTISYNKETKCANWVKWILSEEHTDGPFPRKGAIYYKNDGSAYGIGVVNNIMVQNPYVIDLETEAPRQTHEDWKDVKYNMSHGHLCPAGDNKWSKAAMNQSFLLSNICPQDRDLNNGDWKALEEKCRTWAKRYGELQIVAGPIFNNGEITRFMGVNRIAIPDGFFKVIMYMNKNPQAIGFVFPNESNHHDMNHYVVTVDEIEMITGIDFFSELPDSIENEIEAYSNIEDWK